MERSRKYRQVLAASFANLTILVSGIALSWTSPIESMLKDPKLTPLGEPVTDAQFAWISSLAALGAACGPFMAVGMTERLGRRWSILVASVPMLLGWVLVAAAQNVAMIYVARILWGIAVGIAFMVTPMYVGEIAETEIRGALGSFMQIFVVTGNLIIYSVGSFLSYAMISVLGIASTALAAICFFFMPESPIHCVNKGNRKAASASLQFLRGKSEQGVELELQTLEAETKLTQQQEGGLKEIFTSKGNFKALYISCILMAVQQFSGINVVLFNMQGIFSKAGAGVDPSLAAIIIGAVQVLSSCITPFVVDRLGRRILLLISSVGMTIGLGLLGLFFFFDDRGNPVVEFISWLPVASLVLYMIVYNTGYGPVPWTIMGEMFATNIKSKGALFTTAFSWLMAFLITRFFSDIEAAIGIYSAFWMFCIFCIFGFIFVMFYVPETKGRSLQEIQDILNIRLVKVVPLPDVSEPVAPSSAARRILSILLAAEEGATGSETSGKGYGPVPWTIMGEMFATNVKSKGALFTTAFSWLMAFLITRFFSNIAAAIDIYSAFWIFCIFCIFGYIFVLFYIPETQRRSLQEIQDILNIRKSSEY